MSRKLEITIQEDGPYRIRNARSARFGDEELNTEDDI